jgi:hypothetical protein
MQMLHRNQNAGLLKITHCRIRLQSRFIPRNMAENNWELSHVVVGKDQDLRAYLIRYYLLLLYYIILYYIILFCEA